MAEFQTVCRVADVPEGEGLSVEVGTKAVAVFRENGQFYAIDDFCPHMGSPLSGGHLEKGTVTCPWHAWRFRLADGAWADNPRIKIGCHAVRVAGDELQVALVEVNPRGRANGAVPGRSQAGTGGDGDRAAGGAGGAATGPAGLEGSTPPGAGG
jgi:nitrite reductase (NADH) small subunit/3-phenylpropionate/trans-cinnamate dioxygenase ferredoxin subunit